MSNSERSYEYIRVDHANHVTTITFARPAVRNAFNNAMYLEVAAAIQAASENEDVHVIVLTGEGDFFCAGQDLSELKMPEEGTELGFPKLLIQLQSNRKPLLAAVNGPGVGLGLTMLLHTDINIISSTSRFRLPFVTLAVVPEAASSFLLPRAFGAQRAAEILYTARWIAAEELKEVGLALDVVAPEEVLPRTLELAARIAAMPPLSVQHTRALTREPLQMEIFQALQREGEAFRERLGSPEQQEAVARFFQKK